MQPRQMQSCSIGRQPSSVLGTRCPALHRAQLLRPGASSLAHGVISKKSAAINSQRPANDEGPSSGASMLAVTAMSLLLSMNTMMASPALATDCEDLSGFERRQCELERRRELLRQTREKAESVNAPDVKVQEADAAVEDANAKRREEAVKRAEAMRKLSVESYEQQAQKSLKAPPANPLENSPLNFSLPPPPEKLSDIKLPDFKSFSLPQGLPSLPEGLTKGLPSLPKMPKLEMPKMPEAQEEEVSQDKPDTDMPKLDMPKFDMPKMDMPKMDMPKMEMPDMPKFNMPKMEVPDMPKFDMPKMDMPKVEMPKLDMPKVEVTPAPAPPPPKPVLPPPPPPPPPAPAPEPIISRPAPSRYEEPPSRKQEAPKPAASQQAQQGNKRKGPLPVVLAQLIVLGLIVATGLAFTKFSNTTFAVLDSFSKLVVGLYQRLEALTSKK